MQSSDYYVYILTNKNNNVLYIGMTCDLIKRLWEHKTKFFSKAFSARYNICKLVYFEHFEDFDAALFRERQLKAGPRRKKLALIKKENGKFKDLSEKWFD